MNLTTQYTRVAVQVPEVVPKKITSLSILSRSNLLLNPTPCYTTVRIAATPQILEGPIKGRTLFSEDPRVSNWMHGHGLAKQLLMRALTTVELNGGGFIAIDPTELPIGAVSYVSKEGALEIEFIGVAEEFQGKGVATSLVKKMKEKATQESRILLVSSSEYLMPLLFKEGFIWQKSFKKNPRKPALVWFPPGKEPAIQDEGMFKYQHPGNNKWYEVPKKFPRSP